MTKSQVVTKSPHCLCVDITSPPTLPHNHTPPNPLCMMTLSTILTGVRVAVSPLSLTVPSCKSSPAQTLELFLPSSQSVALSPVSAWRAAAGILATLSHSLGGDKEGLSSGHKTDRLDANLKTLDTAL